MKQLEAEKLTRLKEQQDILMETRLQKQQELAEAHRQEAQSKGLEESTLVDSALMSRDKLQKDLELLAKHQQKLLNDLLSAEDDDEDETTRKRNAMNQKMEARMKELNDTLKQSILQIIPADDTSSTLTSHHSSVKSRLASRIKGRRRQPRSPTDSTSEDDSDLINAKEVEDIVMHAVAASLLEEERKKQQEAIAMLDIDEQSKDALIIQYKEDAEEVDKQVEIENKWRKVQAVALLTAQSVVQEEIKKESVVNEQLKVSSVTQAQLGDPAKQLPQVEAQSAEAQQAREALVEQQVQQQTSMEVEVEQERLKVEQVLDNEKSAHQKLMEKQAEQQQKKDNCFSLCVSLRICKQILQVLVPFHYNAVMVQ